jgi:thiamine pyrophosphate-dependent acetolactate synthase large subunit-like protein
MSFTKHSFFVDDVDMIPTIVREAIKIATTGRP